MKARSEAEKEEAARLKQGSLDPHLADLGQKERVLPYTDSLFRQAAIDWLIATDQVYLLTRIEAPLTSSICSQSKHLNIRNFRKWSISQLEQQPASKYLAEKQLGRKLLVPSKKNLTDLRNKLNVGLFFLFLLFFDDFINLARAPKAAL